MSTAEKTPKVSKGGKKPKTGGKSAASGGKN